MPEFHVTKLQICGPGVTNSGSRALQRAHSSKLANLFRVRAYSVQCSGREGTPTLDRMARIIYPFQSDIFHSIISCKHLLSQF